MADYLSERLNQLDIPFEEDNTGNKINGNSGNILARFYSESGSEPPLLITCHMDTVTSSANVKPVIQNGVISSDGTTILGADNRAGMAMILYVLEEISRENRPHRNLEIVFSVAEELGMWGMTHVDFKSLESREGYVLDCSRDVGCYVQKTPGAIDLHLNCCGKAAHSGIAPEKGINALSMAVELLAGFPVGRIDAETTTNIGTFHAGAARNIVPDHVSALGEIRSFNPQKMQYLLSDLRNHAKKIAAKYGGTIDVTAEKGFTGFNLNKDLPVIRSLETGPGGNGHHTRAFGLLRWKRCECY